MRTTLKLGAVVATFALALSPTGSAVAAVRTSVANIIKTSDWKTPSPDPTGLTYRPSTDTVFVVDSEVEETHRWNGVNLWEIERSGKVVSRGSTKVFSGEPSDVGFSPRTKRFFVSDDNKDRVFIVRLGPDHRMGTTDDTVRSFSTRAFGSHDPEGVDFGAHTIFISDGDGQWVFQVKPGPNGVFDGAGSTGDDVVHHFSTDPLGLEDPEDVAYDGRTRHLFIVSRFDEIVAVSTLGGGLRKTYDLSNSSVLQPAGVTVLPSPTGGRGMRIFVADRGYDNDLHPSENDGRIFAYEKR